jgi:hypothetical protein
MDEILRPEMDGLAGEIAKPALFEQLQSLNGCSRDRQGVLIAG